MRIEIKKTVAVLLKKKKHPKKFHPPRMVHQLQANFKVNYLIRSIKFSSFVPTDSNGLEIEDNRQDQPTEGFSPRFD